MPTAIKTGRPGLGADEEGLSLVGDAMKNGIDFFTLGVAPKVEEREAPQLLEEKRIGPRTRNPKRKAALVVEVEHERVGQHASDRAGVERIALGRAAPASQLVPVGMKFHRGSELHSEFPAARSLACVPEWHAIDLSAWAYVRRGRDHAISQRNGARQASRDRLSRGYLALTLKRMGPVQNRHIHGT